MITALIVIIILQAGAIVTLFWRQPRPVSYGSLEAAVDAMTRIAAGLHEDVDSVRQELRALVNLPKSTAIPHITRELQLFRVGFVVQSVVLGALILFELTAQRAPLLLGGL